MGGGWGRILAFCINSIIQIFNCLKTLILIIILYFDYDSGKRSVLKEVIYSRLRCLEIDMRFAISICRMKKNVGRPTRKLLCRSLEVCSLMMIDPQFVLCLLAWI